MQLYNLLSAFALISPSVCAPTTDTGLAARYNYCFQYWNNRCWRKGGYTMKKRYNYCFQYWNNRCWRKGGYTMKRDLVFRRDANENLIDIEDGVLDRLTDKFNLDIGKVASFFGLEEAGDPEEAATGSEEESGDFKLAFTPEGLEEFVKTMGLPFEDVAHVLGLEAAD